MPHLSPNVPATSLAGSRPNTPRSRATSRRALSVAGGDLRKAWARRMLDILDGHIADLGGQDAISQAEISILRRAAVITIELERLEAKFAEGEASDHQLDLYSRMAGNLRRLLESVGLQRRQRDVTMNLQQYLAARVAQSELEDEADEAEVEQHREAEQC